MSTGDGGSHWDGSEGNGLFLKIDFNKTIRVVANVIFNISTVTFMFKHILW